MRTYARHTHVTRTYAHAREKTGKDITDMATVLHWTPEQLEAYRLRLGGKPSRTPAARRKAEAQQTDRAKDAAKDASPPCHPPRARDGSVPPDPSALPDYRPNEVKSVPVRGWNGRQTETEKRYNAQILHGLGRFEAVTLVLPGGGRYTPDFMTLDDGRVTFHEVKGSYRLGSQGRAYTAFHEAAAAFPFFRFVWAAERAKKDGGGFSVKTFDSSAIAEGPAT